jgi:spermidine dehydrogenase
LKQPIACATASAALEGGVEAFRPLVVVGAGISGWLPRTTFARIPVPGSCCWTITTNSAVTPAGEFSVDGRLLIGYGGQAIQSPHALWSPSARQLLADIVDLRYSTPPLIAPCIPGLGLSRGIFRARSVRHRPAGARRPMRLAADEIPRGERPLQPTALPIIPCPQSRGACWHSTKQRDVLQACRRATHPFSNTSAIAISLKYWGLDELAASTLQGHPTISLGSASMPGGAQILYASQFRAFGPRLKPSVESRAVMDEPYIYHFGQQRIAGQTPVRQLIPAPRRATMSDIVTAKFDCARLDQEQSATRLRLSSTVVAIKQCGHIDVGYVRAGRPEGEAKHAIFAGYGTMLPYICTDLMLGNARLLRRRPIPTRLRQRCRAQLAPLDQAGGS